jgi:phosphatidylglycerophosphate synthase
MKQLNSLQNLIFLAGGALMVIGVALNFFGFQQVAACLFLLGAVCFGGMQMMQTYEGNNVVIRRLRRIMTLADVLFIVSGLLLLEQNFNFLMPLFQKNGMQGMIYYAQYVVHKNWVLVLFVAALLELYTMHRISSELAEEAKKL